MRWIRDALCAIALGALTAISLWAAITVAQGLPKREVAESLELGQWLTHRDLSQATGEERSRVIRQFDARLHVGQELGAELQSLDEHEKRLLKDNIALLLEQWFREKAQTYAQLRPKQRAAWLDAEIDRIERLTGRGRDLRGAVRPEMIGALGIINNQVDQWIERAEPSDQQDMREFWRAVQARVVARLQSQPDR